MSIERAAATQQHRDIIDKWKTEEGSNWEYFEQADSEAWTKAFWSEGGRYKKLFDHLDVTRLAEIACGQGRHSLKVVERCQSLWLIDSSVDALKNAAVRFSSYQQAVTVLSEDGLSLPIPSGVATAVFSYDAMVHFELMTVACYIQEASRVLCPGGRGLFHHSNYSGNPTGSIDENPGWRNFMTLDIARHLFSRAGLRIIEQQSFDRDAPNSDALTLFEKPM